jgi:hypothetical protein
MARQVNIGYFIPPQPGSLDNYLSYPCDTDNVFVEWDRKLMWVGTGTVLYLVVSPPLGKPVLEPNSRQAMVPAGTKRRPSLDDSLFLPKSSTPN